MNLHRASAVQALVLLALGGCCATGPSAPRGAMDASAGWSVASVRKAEDQVAVARSGRVLCVTVQCPSGIGAAEMVRRGGPWPGEIRLRLLYAPGRPFTRLEGLDATLGGASPVALHKADGTLTSGPEGVEVSLTVPAGELSRAVLRLSWVDAYR